MKKRNLFILFVTVTLFGSVFVACSDGGTGQGHADTEDTAENEAVEITFQHIGGTVPQQEEVLEKMAVEFEGKTGVKVTVVNVGWGEAYSLFQRQVVAGEAPDLVMLQGPWANEYMNLGALAPVDDYVSEEVLNNFIETGFAPVSGDDGKLYGIPWDGSIWGFFYRKDLFEEAGLDPEQPPKNWDELLEYAEKLTDDGQYGLVFPATGWEPDDYFLPFMWQAGNEVVEFEGETWKSVIADESGLEAAQYVYDLVNKHKVVPKSITGMDWEAVANQFISGKAAMMFNGMWATGSLEGNQEIEGKWATALSPEGPTGVKAVLGYPNTLHITEQSAHKEEVGQFIDFIFSGERPNLFEEYMIATGVVGWTKDFSELPYAQTEVIKPFVEQIEFAKNRPIVPNYEEFRQSYFNPGIQDLIMGELNPEEFVEEMDKAFNELQK